MKKQLFLSVVAFMFCLQIQAQIVLTQANTEFTPGVITAIGADTSGFTAPSVGLNQQWDYSDLIQNSTSSWTSISVISLPFPTVTYVDTNLSSLFVPGWWYKYDAYYETSANGVNCLGVVVNDQRTGLLSLTGNAADSCIFPTQILVYDTTSYTLPFPATMSTSWRTSMRTFVDFKLTISAYALNQTPCQKVTNSVRFDSIISWGTLRVPTALGHSLAYEVLLVKRMYVQIDSFYMAGAPAPAPLLAAFGITQGQSTTLNRYLFWRKDARYPLLMINFSASNFIKPTSIYYDGAAQFDPTGTDEIQQNSDITVYPNPNNGDFFIQVDQIKDEPFELNIYNLVGQIVYTQQIIPSGNNSQQIQIENLNHGTYFVRINSENKILTSKLIIE